jgi:arsenate reductase
MSDQPTVLFVCVHNAGRSQMAAGYLEHLVFGQGIEAVRPIRDEIRVRVEALMAELLPA